MPHICLRIEVPLSQQDGHSTAQKSGGGRSRGSTAGGTWQREGRSRERSRTEQTAGREPGRGESQEGPGGRQTDVQGRGSAPRWGRPSPPPTAHDASGIPARSRQVEQEASVHGCRCNATADDAMILRAHAGAWMHGRCGAGLSDAPTVPRRGREAPAGLSARLRVPPAGRPCQSRARRDACCSPFGIIPIPVIPPSASD